jgi:uncharacterized SAM-binding protein YcdF (DUF218 family)
MEHHIHTAAPVEINRRSAALRQSGRRRGLRWLGAACVLLLLVGLATYAFHRPLLRGFASALTVDDAVAPADFLYVLGGDVNTRPFHAAALFRRGFAPRVVVPRTEDRPASERGFYPNDADVAVRILQHQGVPDSAIIMLRIPGGVTSTQDEGRVLRDYLQTHPAQKLIVVTSAYHTRRARWTLRRELEGLPVDLRMAAAPDDRFDAGNWWTREAGFLAYVSETFKFLHTLLRG